MSFSQKDENWGARLSPMLYLDSPKREADARKNKARRSGLSKYSEIPNSSKID